MFTLNNMQALLHARPFVPFRLWLSDGGAINVRSSELVLPGRQYAIIGLLDPNAIEESFDRHVVVWYMHVTRCESLTPGASPLASPGEPPPGTPAPATGS
ncbi:MAG: hypothetical protein ACRELF_30010 [Gemmataceae bacterium]